MSQATAPHPVCLIPRLDFEEQLEDLMGQYKDLWEFHVSHSELLSPPCTASLAALGPELCHPQASLLSMATPSS